MMLKNFILEKHQIFKTTNSLEDYKQLYKDVSVNLRKYYVSCKPLKQSQIKLHIWFTEDKHYRIKVLQNYNSLCEYYADDEEVKTKGKHCDKVPKVVDKFLRAYLSKCWHTFVNRIQARDPTILDDLYASMKLYSLKREIFC